MQFKDIEDMCIVYGKRSLLLDFLEQFNNDRAQDGAPLKAVLVQGDMKKELKKFVWKGD